MTIGELSLASGLPASTIRYWEKVGVMLSLPESAVKGDTRVMRSIA